MLSLGSRQRVFMSVSLCFVLASAVSAATVTTVTGKVSINRGSGFAPISSETTANPGDRVMAGPSGSAEIIYENGCRERVEPGSVVRVAEARCKTAGFSTTELVVGAVVVGGGVAAAIALSDHGHHSASP